ncbi:MAG: bifunctional [glutamine synthetase] adenylyltransferase/[glutamine synthetase]-adenylyl-L-tyrosine phosphorylase [Actinomycetaceae bacterium]|nr:bifunctional [glutamine synthetase] adenylyltransferase/[glutamine synthetase]-adenylyl-L-tyrosine phosphorylase [Actinomycetaceae bacterium]
MSRPVSAVSAAIKAGFAQPQRAVEHVQQLHATLGLAGSWEGLLPWFSDVADPDAACLLALRLAEADAQVLGQVLGDGARRGRLLAVLGASQALGEYLVKNPAWCLQIDSDLPAGRPVSTGDWEPPPAPEQMINWLRTLASELTAAQDSSKTSIALHASVPNSAYECAGKAGSGFDCAGLRAAYWRAVILIAAKDLTSPAGAQSQELTGRGRAGSLQQVSTQLTDLVDATIELALELAQRQVRDSGHCRGEVEANLLSVIAMGKTGGQEINYISDVDLIYVLPDQTGEETTAADPTRASEHTQFYTAVANALSTVVSGPGSEPPLWPIDTALRPEGKDGQLVRTLSACASYYRNWARGWEFHALLKARPAAGNHQLGTQFLQLVEPLVWEAASKPGFVDDVRAMRKQVESHLPAGQKERNLKLGAGGLRDVEFTVQLLQLVHGRTDPTVRPRNTLAAIESLAAGGYVARTDARVLTDAYTFLRVVEHSLQLVAMRRTHLLPTADNQLRRLGRSIDTRRYPLAEDVAESLRDVRSQVRQLHESIFFRPLVEATANLSPTAVLMFDSQALTDRLLAAGYQDPRGARQHLQSLAQGTSRRATIQRHLLPVLLGWLAQGADPDAGLLAFRRLSDAIGSSHWYLALLRDSAVAARNLCKILPNSVLTERLLMANPEAVKWLDDPSSLARFDVELIASQAQAIEERYEQTQAAIEPLLQLRQRQLTRAALADCTLGVEVGRTAQGLTTATDLVLAAATRIALKETGVQAGFDLGFVAMGRYGGQELSYGSDADVIAVYDPGNMEENDAAQVAQQVVQRVTALVAGCGARPGIELDLALRPEGRNGPLARTVAGYTDYWHRWAQTWEKQALLRARTVGDSPVVMQLMEQINQVRYGTELTASMLKDIRLLKARMESERLPRGVKPSEHLKLGPGGISDVEWVAQLCQLQLARTEESLRVTGTIPALRAAVEVGALDAHTGRWLQQAWILASEIRSANMLALDQGRYRDVLMRGGQGGRKVAALLGYPAGDYGQVVELWRKRSRRARSLYESFIQSL